MMLKKNLCLIGCLLLSACCSSLTVERTTDLKLFDLNKTIYIAKPEDGKYNNMLYLQSGEMTVDAISNALYLHAPKVIKATKTEDKQQALKSAKKASADIVIIPSILHWEDRATQLVGETDKINLAMEIIDTKNNEQLDKAIIHSTSGCYSFINTPPSDLLAPMLDEYFKAFITKQEEE